MNRKKKWAVLVFSLAAVLAAGVWGAVFIHGVLFARGCLALPQDVVAGQVLPKHPDTVRFLALGDVGTGNSDQRRVAKTAARLCGKIECDFLLLLGDNFYNRGVTSLQDTKLVKVFEEVYGGLGKPVFAVLGNHDIRENALAQVLYSQVSPTWRMPNFNYAFQAGPAHFTVVNTNCHILNLLGISSNLAEHSADWTFLLGHHTLYSDGNHGDADWLARWYWQANVAEHVDFYLSGHDHQLGHLKYRNRRSDYVISGAGGRHSRDSNPKRWAPSTAKGLFRYLDNGLVLFEVSPARALVRFYDGDGALLYEFVKEKPRPGRKDSQP